MMITDVEKFGQALLWIISGLGPAVYLSFVICRSLRVAELILHCIYGIILGPIASALLAIYFLRKPILKIMSIEIFNKDKE